ncbi:ABC transporter permease [Nonomuraea sp. NPDC051941]|uniref:ABC transporter permease n=1 Tax=Nonomuraea sp. NPDC051941 TaxID=3364373 RepID=UPI0037CC5993
MIKIFLAAARFQALLLRAALADLAPLLTVPIFALILLAVMMDAGRADLAPYAIVGATVVAVWNMALNVSGGLIESERRCGTLEASISVPAPLTVVILGRTTTITLISMFALAESLLVARLGFDVAVSVPHPGLLAAAIAATVLAMVGTATALAGMFVLARSARTFQNSVSYPFFLLSGAVVPPAFLPEWLQPATKLVFLSWSTDLVRDSLRPGPITDAFPRLLVLLALGAVGYGVGAWMLTRILRRVRTTGAVNYT